MADESNNSGPRTYRGNCHCGAFVYEIDVPEPITTGIDCNCTFCTRRGTCPYTMPPENSVFRVVKGDEDVDLRTYNFGASRVHHKFCPKCGTDILRRFPSGPPELQLAFNLRAIQGLNTWSLKREKFNGAALSSPYERPEYTGPQPSAHVENGQLYTGGCHCGKVQIAVSYEPLTETSYPVGDCNCSICDRMAALWMWPEHKHVVLHGDQADIGRYSFGYNILSKTFCKTCGVPLSNEPIEKTKEEIAALPNRHRQFLEGAKTLHPVNVRVLDGVDLEKINIEKRTEASSLIPFYVNP